VAFAAAPALLAATTPAAADEPPPGPELDLIKQKCVSCHSLSMITSKRKTPEEWAAPVDTMAGRGADVSPEEMDAIVKYLAKAYPAANPSEASRKTQ
jgi:cytochrome c5